MSCVYLLCADRPMPLWKAGTRRTRTAGYGREAITVEEDGFSVQEHRYYRPAVDELNLSMKPCRYELDLRATWEDVRGLRAYLTANANPSEQVELWYLWVGDAPSRVRRFCGPLSDMAVDTLEQLEEYAPTCLTIEI